MSQKGPDRHELKTLEALVTACADEQLQRFAGVRAHEKADGSVVTELDHALQRRLEEALRSHRPAYRFLAEEMPAERQHSLLASAEGPLWVLDPLDGTTNFAAGLPFYSVSLGLVSGGEAIAGIVYDPVRRECFSASRGHGVWCNGASLTPASHAHGLRDALACVDFKRLPKPLAGRLAAQPPYRSQRNLGSCALEWCWLAAGRFHIYLHGGMKLWDHAAGHLILSEAGGRATTLADAPIRCDTTEPRSVVAALDPPLQRQWHAWLNGTS